MDDRLRPLWDFDDLDVTEQRLRAQLDSERSDDGRAEVLAQLARIEKLRGRFDEGERLVEEAEGLGSTSAVVRSRNDLERGRLRRSSGDRESARPLFESAYALALEAGTYFIAADAAHMVALTASDRAQLVTWTTRGIELAESHDAASYWLGPLLNNLGREYYEAGRFEPALDAFERALAARESKLEQHAPIEIARYAVGKTLRALGRASEAIPHLERAVDWATRNGAPDGWFHEELAEEYAAVGRAVDSRAQALPLLDRDDPALADDSERRARLVRLAES